MIYTPRAISPFNRMTDESFEAKARSIQNKLLAGPEFSTVTPPPSSVLPALDVYKAYLLEVEERNYKNVIPRRQLRKSITAMLKQQCISVNAIANGDPQTMVNSGFDISKEPEIHPVPTVGKIKSVTPLIDGQAIVRFMGIKFRDFYELLVTGANYSKLETVVHTQAKLTDLPLNVDLKVVVRGVNGKGDGEWSSPVSFVASKVSGTGDTTNP